MESTLLTLKRVSFGPDSMTDNVLDSASRLLHPQLGLRVHLARRVEPREPLELHDGIPEGVGGEQIGASALHLAVVHVAEAHQIHLKEDHVIKSPVF